MNKKENNPLKAEVKVYTTSEVAKILKLSQASVRKLITSGQLKASRVGGRLWRVRLEDIQDFLDSGMTA